MPQKKNNTIALKNKMGQKKRKQNTSLFTLEL